MPAERSPRLAFDAVLSRRYHSVHHCVGRLRCEVEHPSHTAVFLCTAVENELLVFEAAEPKFSVFG